MFNRNHRDYAMHPTFQTFCNVRLALCVVLALAFGNASPSLAFETGSAESGSALNSPNAEAGAPTRAAPRPASLKRLSSEIDLEAMRLKNILDDVSAMENRLQNDIQKAQSEAQRLYALYHLYNTSPLIMANIFTQMEGVQRAFLVSVQPFESALAVMERSRDSLSVLQKQVDAPVSGSNAMFEESPGYEREYARIRDAMTAAEKTLQVLTELSSGYAKDARSSQKMLADMTGEFSSMLPRLWQSYYLESVHVTSPESEAVSSSLGKWWRNLGATWAYSHPEATDDWLHSMRRGAVCLGVLLALCVGVFAVCGHMGAPWSAALRRFLLVGWLPLCVGGALVVASNDPYGGNYLFPLETGAVLVMLGVAVGSYAARRQAHAQLKGFPTFLICLPLPLVIGSFLLFSQMPYRMVNVIWPIVLVLFFLLLTRFHNAPCGKEQLPPLERYGKGLFMVFSLALALMGLIGLGRLSVLVFAGLVAFVQVLIIRDLAAGLGRALVEKAWPMADGRMMNAVLGSAVLPVSWLVGLAACLPVVWIMPGADYMLRHLFTANVTVGETAVGIHRFALVIVLWFVMHVLVNIIRAGIDELPSRLPNFAEATVPTLKRFTSYGLWTLFVLAALEMAGVSLTSLKIIAGGLSVGVGFGLQTIFNNLVSGLMLLFGRNIMVGDVIKVGDSGGVVREVNIRSTTIETADGSLMYIPNSTIMTGDLLNISRSNRHILQAVTVRVKQPEHPGMSGRNDQVDTPDALTYWQLSAWLQASVKDEPAVLRTPKPQVRKEDVNEGEVCATLTFLVDDRKRLNGTLVSLREKIKKFLEGYSHELKEGYGVS